MTKKNKQKIKITKQPQLPQGDFSHEFASEPLSEESKQNNKKRKKNQ